MIFDLHIHTRYSRCSTLALSDLVDRALDLGLDGIAVTDHHTMEAENYFALHKPVPGLTIIVGMEYSTPQGDFLIFGPFHDLQPGLTAFELLPHIHENRGAAIAAHPLRKTRPVHETVAAANLFSVIETKNGRNTPEENCITGSWIEKTDCFAIGGSDAHGLDEIGRYVTVFKNGIVNRNDLIRELLAGDYKPAALHELSAASATA